MVTDINFGTLGTVGGKTVTSGSASGLDTEALINSLVETRRLPAVALEGDIEFNNSQITAYNSLAEIVQRLQDSFNSLRNPSGFGSSTQNVFDSRTTFLSTNDGTNAGNYIGVSASDAAAIGKYTIDVNQLAQGAIYQTDAPGFATRDTDIVDTGLLNAGNFDLNGSTITVDADDSLNAIVSKINNVSDDTNVEASILKIADGDFRLVLTNTETGLTDGAITITDTDNVFGSKPISQIQPPQNAEIDYIVNGVPTTISRSTNTINDFIDNVTITLFEETPVNTEITIDVDKDITAVSTAIVDFVNGYNDLRVFNAQQNEVDDDGQFLDTAILRNSSILDSVVSGLANIISSTVDSPLQGDLQIDDGIIDRVGDLGIEFDTFNGSSDDGIPLTTNILSIDLATLTTKLQSNFDDVRELFELSFSSDSTEFAILDSGSITSEETLSVTVTGGATAVVTAIDGNDLVSDVNLTYDTTDTRVTSGDTPGLVAILKGQNGTAFEGVELFYYGDGDSTDSFATVVEGGEKDYTIDVNDTAETAQLTHIRGLELTTAIDLTYTKSSSGGGASVAGPDGGPFGTFEFLYVGGSTETINFSVQQGIADQLFNNVENLATPSTGQIALEISSLLTSNDRIQDSIDRIDRQIVSYRERLLDQFAALEAAISASESILQLLDAQANARNNS